MSVAPATSRDSGDRSSESLVRGAGSGVDATEWRSGKVEIMREREIERDIEREREGGEANKRHCLRQRDVMCSLWPGLQQPPADETGNLSPDEREWYSSFFYLYSASNKISVYLNSVRRRESISRQWSLPLCSSCHRCRG